MARKAKSVRKTKVSRKAKVKEAKRLLAGKVPGKPVAKPADHRIRRGKDAVPPAGRDKVVEVMYMPEENGPEMTVVDGIPFRAFEPTVVPVERQNMLVTLSQNPFFNVDGKLTDAQKSRMKLWQTKRAHEEKLDDLNKAHEAKMASLRGPDLGPGSPGAPGVPSNPPRTS